MNFKTRLTEPHAVFQLNIEGTGAADQYAEHPTPTHAILFHRDQVDLDELEEEMESWLETAEDEEDDEDLVLCGFHPIDGDLQVERLFYYKKSEDGAVVYSLDVDGTAVPDTLEAFSQTFACFEPSDEE